MAFVERLRHALPANVLDVRLFGSEARGAATPESDIDVLVVVQPDTDRVRLEDRIIDIAFDVNLHFGVYVSPRVVTLGILNDPVWGETPFIRNVARESTRACRARRSRYPHCTTVLQRRDEPRVTGTSANRRVRKCSLCAISFKRWFVRATNSFAASDQSSWGGSLDGFRTL